MPHIASAALWRRGLDADVFQSKNNNNEKKKEIEAFAFFQGTCQSSAV